MEVVCKNLTAASVLAHLYNNAKPLGMGLYQYKAKAMTVEEAEKELEVTKYFDYLYGRPLKTDFDTFPKLKSRGYDHDQGGEGTMKRLIEELQLSGAIDTAIPIDPPSPALLKKTLEKSNAGMRISSYPAPKSYGGKSAKDMKLNKFDQVYFEKEFCKEIENMEIPYPNEWHMYMDTTEGKARFVGSMGGGFAINENIACIKKKQAGF